jgi:hypothetical protein
METLPEALTVARAACDHPATIDLLSIKHNTPPLNPTLIRKPIKPGGFHPAFLSPIFSRLESIIEACPQRILLASA